MYYAINEGKASHFQSGEWGLSSPPPSHFSSPSYVNVAVQILVRLHTRQAGLSSKLGSSSMQACYCIGVHVQVCLLMHRIKVTLTELCIVAKCIVIPNAEPDSFDVDVEMYARTWLSPLSTEPWVIFTQACTLPLCSGTSVVSPAIVITIKVG